MRWVRSVWRAVGDGYPTVRELASYSIPQWLALKPAVDRFKFVRNRALERFYRHSGSAGRDRFLADNAEKLKPNLAVTVAYNTPWVVELFLRTAKVNLPDTSVVIADNSSDSHARTVIAELCDAYDVAYASLPRNPEWHPNRSHGIALNWAYYNLIEPLAPQVFAFLDHDVFALSRFDLAQAVARQPVYGPCKRSSEQDAWTLWAGYAVFDHAAVRDYKPDFNYDEPLRLDTGGNNWRRIYRHLRADAMRFAELRLVRFRDPDNCAIHSCLLLDSFAHVGGASHRPERPWAERIAFFRRLVAHVEAGGDWTDLVTTDRA